MKRLSFLLIIIFSDFALAQNPGNTGSVGLFHTHTGRVLDQGQLKFSSNLNFFTKLGDFLGDPNLKPADFKSANYWLVASNISASYGIYNNLDATLAVRLYQDTHYSNEFNLPDDVFLTIKGGNFVFGRKRFFASVMSAFRFATGEVHNYPFAEYASGAFEYGFFSAISYYSDPYFIDRSFSMHYNLGWWNHNEAGTEFTLPNKVKKTATVNSSNIQMALATIIPFGLFDFRLELAGILFTSEPDPFIYSAEEWAYLTPSIHYKPYDWVSMDLGIDIRVSPGDRQKTSGVPDISGNLDLPKNFPAWKVQMGLNFSLWTGGEKETYSSRGESEDYKKRLQIYETLQKEKQRSEDVEKELEELRKERKKADKEIEELKQILEDEG